VRFGNSISMSTSASSPYSSCASLSEISVAALVTSETMCLMAKRVDLAGLLVETGFQVLVRLVVLARRRQHGIFDRR
jgi:hypothetical protein